MRGGPAGRGARGGPGAIDFEESEPAVESVDSLLTVRAGGAGIHGANGIGWSWPWGNPRTPYNTPNFFNPGSFKNGASTTSWAFPGSNRIFMWPQIFGVTRTVNALAISRRSASALSLSNSIALAIYGSSGTPVLRNQYQRLWDTVGVLFPTLPVDGSNFQTASQSDLGSLSYFQVNPAVTFEPGEVYWLAMMYAEDLITNNVAINAFHASQLDPYWGVQFKHELSNIDNAAAYTITPASPQPSFGLGYVYRDSTETNAIAIPSPWRLPKGIGFVGLTNEDGSTIDFNTSGPKLYDPTGPYDKGMRFVLQSTGNGGANVPAIWTALS